MSFNTDVLTEGAAETLVNLDVEWPKETAPARGKAGAAWNSAGRGLSDRHGSDVGSQSVDPN
jgi:hypothetical protein